jgi:ABC-type multidrug transport system ATPase subunit
VDLQVSVSTGSKEKGTTEKTLLNNVNAEAYHGQILAIVGPSGSGKTTFLDALAGRVASKSLEGEIFVNGELIDDSFKRISGYVMQDDALFPMLTVRETLLYSARLRLPSSMPVAEKKIRVENMIKQLGLVQCADTKVGNDTVGRLFYPPFLVLHMFMNFCRLFCKIIELLSLYCMGKEDERKTD